MNTQGVSALANGTAGVSLLPVKGEWRDLLAPGELLLLAPPVAPAAGPTARAGRLVGRRENQIFRVAL